MLLLDTHVLLWWLADDPRLTESARRAVADPEAAVHVSAASIWEAEIKASLGRLDLGTDDLAGLLGPNGFEELPIRAADCRTAARLPAHHRDPFDRMLVAQARIHDLVLLTADERLGVYDVRIRPV